MGEFVFEPPAVVSLPVVGSSRRFPVRRVYCVARNYAAHAAEMGASDREPPFFFAKPRDAVVPEGGRIAYPPATRELHHEVELVAALGGGGSALEPEAALGRVFGYGVGVDLTRRDLQTAAKQAGRPWATAKGFDASAPISALRSVADVGHPRGGAIWLEVDGELRQRGDLSEMIWSVGEVLAELSRLFELAAGDLVFTGTPAGVGPLSVGQRVRAGVDGVATLELELAS